MVVPPDCFSLILSSINFLAGLVYFLSRKFYFPAGLVIFLIAFVTTSAALVPFN
jgi:hypothetical protein